MYKNIEQQASKNKSYDFLTLFLNRLVEKCLPAQTTTTIATTEISHIIRTNLIKQSS